MSYTFDGNNLTITPNDASSFSIDDMYSRWKDWVLLFDNSKYPPAFRTVGGDPIGPGQAVSPYYFLNTTAGWHIKPYEEDYELRISGNLYSEDPNLSMFVPTTGGFTVTVIVERSSSAIAVTVGGIDQATVQAAMTAQGYTNVRALKLDNLDSLISSAGLTPQQATMLLEIYSLLGLDPTKPLVVTPTSRRIPADGSVVNQHMTKIGTTVTVQRY